MGGLNDIMEIIQVKFHDIIRIAHTSCKKCVSLVYEIPCPINKKLIKHLTNFGEPVYDLSKSILLQIENEDGHSIQAKLGRTYIKFGMPKVFENTDLDTTTRKLEFEKSLKNWMEEILPIILTK